MLGEVYPLIRGRGRDVLRLKAPKRNKNIKVSLSGAPNHNYYAIDSVISRSVVLVSDHELVTQ